MKLGIFVRSSSLYGKTVWMFVFFSYLQKVSFRKNYYSFTQQFTVFISFIFDHKDFFKEVNIVKIFIVKHSEVLTTRPKIKFLNDTHSLLPSPSHPFTYRAHTHKCYISQNPITFFRVRREEVNLGMDLFVPIKLNLLLRR